MLEVQDVNLADAIDIIEDTAFPQYDEITGEFVAPGENVFLIGPAGVGKTQAINALAEKMGYELITLITSQMNAEQFQGIPSVGSITATNSKGESVKYPSVEYLLDAWQAKTFTLADSGKPVVLFFDELRNAPLDVLAASLNILADRKVNGIDLPKETVIIAASNSGKDSVNPSRFSTPIQGRFTWYAVRQTVEDWCVGAETNWGKRLTYKESVIRTAIVDAIRSGKATLMEPAGNGGAPANLSVGGSSVEAREVAEFAWRSPRSWNRLISQLSAIRTKGRSAAVWLQRATAIATGTVRILGFQEIEGTLKSLSASVCDIQKQVASAQGQRDLAKTFGQRIYNEGRCTATLRSMFREYKGLLGSWTALQDLTGVISSGFLERVNERLTDMNLSDNDRDKKQVADEIWRAVSILKNFHEDLVAESENNFDIDLMITSDMTAKLVEDWRAFWHASMGVEMPAPNLKDSAMNMLKNVRKTLAS